MLVIAVFIFRASANASQTNSVGPTSCEDLWDLVGASGLAAPVSDNTPKDDDAGDATVDPQRIGCWGFQLSGLELARCCRPSRLGISPQAPAQDTLRVSACGFQGTSDLAGEWQVQEVRWGPSRGKSHSSSALSSRCSAARGQRAPRFKELAGRRNKINNLHPHYLSLICTRSLWYTKTRPWSKKLGSSLAQEEQLVPSRFCARVQDSEGSRSAQLWVSGFVVNRKPQKVGNRMKDKQCWDSLDMTLKDGGCCVSSCWASTIDFLRIAPRGAHTKLHHAGTMQIQHANGRINPRTNWRLAEDPVVQGIWRRWPTKLKTSNLKVLHPQTKTPQIR